MAYWEFLLQKEGDRDWLPLETAHVEISEGRYRIIAHTSYCEVPVDVRLSQLLTDQPPPRRKTLKRIGHTTPNGLMVVIPFTHLTPGRWIVKCGAIAVLESSTQAKWEYGVQLEVLAIESGIEYWDTELDEETIAEQLSSDASSEVTAAPEASPSIAITSPVSPEPSSPEAISIPPLLDETVQGTLPLEDLPLRLQLQHQALVAHSPASVVLQGQITTFSQVAGLPGEGTLWVQLRNPETGEAIHQKAQALSMAALPSRFDMPISLPEGISTRLLIGELSLWTAAEPPQILAIQGFTVTLNLDALLEIVANQAERSPDYVFEDLASPMAPEQSQAVKADIDTNISNEEAKSLSSPPVREIPFRLIYLPSTGLTLPPVIYRPIDKKSVGAPSLPSFGTQENHPRGSSPAPDTVVAPTKPITLPPIGHQRSTSAAGQAAIPDSQPTADAALELPSFERPPSSQSPASPQATSSTTANSNADYTQLTFQPDFQGRFWTRLSALAEEAQKAAADYKAQLEAAGVQTSNDATTAAEVELPFSSVQEDSSELNYEVVVYESEDFEPPSANMSEVATNPVVEVLQPDEPDIDELGTIPVPELLMPEGDLIAGTPLPITIRLPMYPRRLAVKVWVTDIQSRTLVDRPRWLMNWTPSNSGEQTALLQLQVPLGSIEARFEAIAIDLATQHESYKVTHVRSIVPANLSDPDIDSVP